MSFNATLFSHLVDFAAVCVPIFLAWSDMRRRSTKDKNEVIKQLAGLEIKVDALWKHYTFERK